LKINDQVVRGYWKLLQYIANISNIFIGNILLPWYGCKYIAIKYLLRGYGQRSFTMAHFPTANIIFKNFVHKYFTSDGILICLQHKKYYSYF
jgi:hypothetical protein